MTKSTLRRPSRKLRYTADEFREVLVELYGPMKDWDLAGAAVEDLGVTQETVNRYLTGGSTASGSIARLAEKLLAEHNARKDFDDVVKQIAMVFANRIMGDFGIRSDQADDPADAVAKIIARLKSKRKPPQGW